MGEASKRVLRFLRPIIRKRFYHDIDPAARASAEVMAERITRWIAPRSVVDVGCGAGYWLAAMKAYGAAEVLGLEGEHPEPTSLQIAPTELQICDLTQPPPLGRRFDLALSLEVAEHLPESAAERFVEYLTLLAPVVIFSAAIPGQGGWGHRNEQWPTYWASWFAGCGYVVYDWMRRELWSSTTVLPWYIQNTLVFVDSGAGGVAEAMRPYRRSADDPSLNVVHPRLFEAFQQPRFAKALVLLWRSMTRV